MPETACYGPVELWQHRPRRWTHGARDITLTVMSEGPINAYRARVAAGELRADPAQAGCVGHPCGGQRPRGRGADIADSDEIAVHGRLSKTRPLLYQHPDSKDSMT